MRLLHTTSFTFEEFFEIEVPKYAILSHRWISGQEISYGDFLKNRRLNEAGSVKSGWEKIKWFAYIARNKYECEWCWIDTCCIDKRSSAELSEAINSMFTWYTKSAICIAYLFDVDGNTSDKQLEESEWFKRGWTLQELLAPRCCHFYAGDCTFIGDRIDLKHRIHDITRIEEHHLERYEHLQASVAQKMSWASRRKTTRAEDTAYCLMGLLGVTMPLLYGEGNQAFKRLQLEVMRQSDDESIFAWLPRADVDTTWTINLRPLSMLADSPAAFQNSGSIGGLPPVIGTTTMPIDRPPYLMTHKGLQMPIPSPVNWMKDAAKFALLQLDCLHFELSQRLSQSCYVYLLIYNIRDNSWVRISVPFHMISPKPMIGRDKSFREKNFETILMRDPTPHTLDMSLATARTTIKMPMMAPYYLFDGSQQPTLAALNFVSLDAGNQIMQDFFQALDGAAQVTEK